MSMINKETYKETDLYNMKWELQTLQDIIREKKNQAEEQVLEGYTKDLIEAVKEGNLSDREIKQFLKSLVQEVRHIERMM